jgi:hypothetical protein
MENPHLLLKMSQLRYEEMLREAETDRLIRQLKQDQPNWLQQVGQRLAAARAQLKVPTGARLYSLLFRPRAVR